MGRSEAGQVKLKVPRKARQDKLEAGHAAGDPPPSYLVRLSPELRLHWALSLRLGLTLGQPSGQRCPWRLLLPLNLIILFTWKREPAGLVAFVYSPETFTSFSKSSPIPSSDIIPLILFLPYIPYIITPAFPYFPYIITPALPYIHTSSPLPSSTSVHHHPFPPIHSRPSPTLPSPPAGSTPEFGRASPGFVEASVGQRGGGDGLKCRGGRGLHAAGGHVGGGGFDHSCSAHTNPANTYSVLPFLSNTCLDDPPLLFSPMYWKYNFWHH
ncbi:hypothetical protein Pcinc_023162 [Petrolisthes cinctipes]|uniref:Uncharacterized protein n=1 Tax=Petrolisthes cinctipes TaxID=88211 RepID=A0AAE1KCL2_PETCI|nr:hypothetical protein Pcinc_023162 [Petrolisthes cinctipes]